MTPRSPVNSSGGNALALPDAVDRLARAPAREEDAIVRVEHDDRLPALVDERAAPDRVRIHRSQVLTERLRIAFPAHTAPKLTSR